MDVQAPTTVASLTLSAPTVTPATIATISTVPQAPTPPTTAQSTLLQDLLNFGSLFRFDHRLKTLEANFSNLSKKTHVWNKMHKAFPLPGDSSHWQYKFPLPVKGCYNQDEGNDDDQDSDEEGEEFIHPKLSIHDEEETKDEESFDPIAKTPKNLDDEGNDDENLGLNVGREERQDAKDDEDELYRDVNINLEGRVVQMVDVHTTQEFKDTHEQLKEQVKVQVSKISPKIEQTMNEQLEAKVLTRSSNSSKTSYAVAADLSKMELKKILIKRIKGNKSIHRSNEQRNLYKALVKAYESDKIILDTYGDTVMLKRCRDDDADKDKEPSARSDRGSKRRRKGKEPESASAPKEKATRSVGKSTQGSKSQKTSASESETAEEPMQTTHEMEEPLHPEFEIGADDQPIAEPSQLPKWFSQQKKPPTPDRYWNKTLPATH
nr:hypothetical protein [Tanacetum cinerariifolium]